MSLRLFVASAALGVSLTAPSVLLAQGVAGGATPPTPPAAAAPAAPASSDPVTAAIDAYRAAEKDVIASGKTGRERFEAINKAATDAIATIKFNDLTIDGFEKLADARLLGRAQGDTMKQIDERLGTLAKDTGAEGARAAMVRATINPIQATDETSWKAYQAEGKTRSVAAMNHPGLAKAVEAGKAKWLLAGGGIDGEMADAAYADALAKVVALPLAPETATRLWYAYLPMADEGSTVSPEAREKIRVACAEKVAKALNEGGSETLNERQRKGLEEQVKSFNGAFAKGKLVGHPAPDIEFQWDNLPGDASKLSDLKGKVVVVDFWAVWCGPCVGSFPQVRELQERYKDFPVVIVGVTDMQGTPRPQVAPGETVEWKPEVQFPALETWSKDDKHLITWPIAVGTGNVFNPEYGVTGIPHVVIIDPEGKVRYRGLHPASEPEKKHEYIDGLLKEFKLPHPGA